MVPKRCFKICLSGQLCRTNVCQINYRHQKYLVRMKCTGLNHIQLLITDAFWPKSVIHTSKTWCIKWPVDWGPNHPSSQHSFHRKTCAKFLPKNWFQKLRLSEVKLWYDLIALKAFSIPSLLVSTLNHQRRPRPLKAQNFSMVHSCFHTIIKSEVSTSARCFYQPSLIFLKYVQFKPTDHKLLNGTDSSFSSLKTHFFAVLYTIKCVLK